MERTHFSKKVMAAVAIVSGVTLLGGGIAVAAGGGPGGRHHRGHHGIAGTVTAVTDPTFAVDRRNGDAAVVTTTPDTKYFETVDATVADATVGSFVVVRGERTEDGDNVTVAAKHIHIRPAPAEGVHRPRGGTVLTNDGSTLTVQRGNGKIITVTTTADTKVRKTTAATFDDIDVGEFVHVRGERTGDNTATAKAVDIDDSTRPAKPERPAPPANEAAASAPASENAQGVPVSATETASDDAPRRPAPGSSVRVGGQIASIDGTTFVLRHRERQITVQTTDATIFKVRHADGTVTDGSFADLAAGNRVMVAGTVQEDGSLLAEKVLTGDGERSEDRPPHTEDGAGAPDDGGRRRGR